jgi:hypothetical protein
MLNHPEDMMRTTPDCPMGDLTIHPTTAILPMLSDDDLADMADDIKANGLLHPIVLDRDGVLVDGRNRLAACKLAGVEPSFTTLPDDIDPVAYILGVNIERRHLSKGQRAMAVVLASRMTTKLSLRALACGTGQNRERVRQAAFVAEHAPRLVAQVMNGEPLNVAYEIAFDEKREWESDRDQDSDAVEIADNLDDDDDNPDDYAPGVPTEPTFGDVKAEVVHEMEHSAGARALKRLIHEIGATGRWAMDDLLAGLSVADRRDLLDTIPTRIAWLESVLAAIEHDRKPPKVVR